MSNEYASDDHELNDDRRRVLRGLAATGIGLAGVPAASARVASRGTVEATSESLWYDGFEHRAIDAELEPADGSLVVSGEGVSASVGEAESVGVQPALDPEWEPETGLVLRGHGIVDGEPGHPLGDVRIARHAESERFIVQPNFEALGAETYRIEGYRDGDLVYEGGGFEGIGDFFETEVRKGCPYNVHVTKFKGQVIFRIRVPNPRCVDPHRFPDDVLVDVDDILVFPEDDLVDEIETVTNADLYADGLSQFAVDGATAGVSGHQVRQVGDARLFPDHGGAFLGVRNIASNDGFAVELDDPEGVGVELDGLELHPEGATITTALRGTVEGRAGSPIGTTSLRCEGETIVASADFSDLDAEGVRVAVFEGDELVGETTTSNGEFAVTSECCLVGWCGGPPRPWPPEPDPWPPEPKPMPLPPGYQFEETVDIELSDGSFYEGDTLQVVPENPGVEVDSVEDFGLTGEGVEGFDVTDVASY